MTIAEQLVNRIVQCRRLGPLLSDREKAAALERIARECQKDYRALTGFWPQVPPPWNYPTA